MLVLINCLSKKNPSDLVLTVAVPKHLAANRYVNSSQAKHQPIDPANSAKSSCHSLGGL
jgi:hypothetical protein